MTVNVGVFGMIFGVFTSLVGYTIHGSLFWSVVDFFFCILAWIKWLIFHEVTLSTVKETFSWFFV